MKRLVVGLLAHVDSGKTTLAEGLLYRAGVLRKLGRVDHRDAFLDTDSQERARGITIFAKQAVLTLPAADGTDETELTLLDTPGHVDFSAEAERALQVLDYAVLVVSGTDGVQAHTETLWKLLARYRVPTFIFVNKMDLPGADAAVRLRELRGRFGDGCVDFTTAPDPEALALCSEPLMEEVLASGISSRETLLMAIARRQVFPCFFGAALRLDGLDGLLHGLQSLTRMPPAWGEFGARVFKVSEDAGTRLSWLKVTGGVLHVKDTLPGGEKADTLRLYSGGKFRLVSECLPGTVVELLQQGDLSERHARALLRLQDPEVQRRAAGDMVRRGMNVAQAEAYVEKLLQSDQVTPPRGRSTYIIKDVRLFLNSVDRGLHLMRQAGVDAGWNRQDTDREILLTIRIPKRASGKIDSVSESC